MKSENLFGSDDQVRAANALLRLKLEVDFGMIASHSSGLPPQLENKWLESVYKYEEAMRDNNRVTVYQHLGMPAFRTWDQIPPHELRDELLELQSLLLKNRVVVDCLGDYNDLTMYRFITESLFSQEMVPIADSNFIVHFLFEECSNPDCP